MKLRNKKTGEIEYLFFNSYPVSGDIVLEYYDENAESGYSEYCRYKTLAELNKEWEDYKPDEPLIKDEKFRRVVRWWAVANDDMPKVLYDKDKDCIYSPFASDKTDTSISLSFDNIHVFEKLEHRKYYTIAELCGEEEE